VEKLRASIRSFSKRVVPRISRPLGLEIFLFYIEKKGAFAMRERLEALKEEAETAIKQTADLESLKELKVKYLGKKGELTSILRGMGSLTPEERPVIGSLANEVRGYLEHLITQKEEAFEEEALEKRLLAEKIDVTLPGIPTMVGSIHPLNLIIEQMEEIFVGMGFEIAEGPEVESDQYNFEALNLPKDHPARDMQYTF
jgi:phenylalanyl-tRNA synthetase alpha chain